MSEEEKKSIEIDLKCLHNIMNNFEDDLCEQMQEKVSEIKQFIEKQQQKLEEKETLYKKALSELVIADKMIDEMAEYIGSNDITEIFCEEKVECDEQCKNCVKEIFRKKVEE